MFNNIGWFLVETVNSARLAMPQGELYSRELRGQNGRGEINWTVFILYDVKGVAFSDNRAIFGTRAIEKGSSLLTQNRPIRKMATSLSVKRGSQNWLCIKS